MPHHLQHPHHHRGDDPELSTVLEGVVGPDGAFRHRQHVHLTFLAVRRHGMPAAIDKVSGWIRQIATYERHPQKYHHTVSRAWVELIAHHVESDPARAEFDRFAQRHPALLDKRLLARHYTSAALATAAARHGWVEPDRLPFPWAGQPGPPEAGPAHPGAARGDAATTRAHAKDE